MLSSDRQEQCCVWLLPCPPLALPQPLFGELSALFDFSQSVWVGNSLCLYLQPSVSDPSPILPALSSAVPRIAAVFGAPYVSVHPVLWGPSTCIHISGLPLASLTGISLISSLKTSNSRLTLFLAQFFALTPPSQVGNSTQLSFSGLVSLLLSLPLSPPECPSSLLALNTFTGLGNTSLSSSKTVVALVVRTITPLPVFS